MLAKLGDTLTSWLGGIQFQYVDYPLNGLRAGPIRLRSIRVRKMGDDNAPLIMVGQLSLIQGGLEFPMGPCDLYDETEALSWDGDMLVEQSSILRLRWAIGDITINNVSSEIGVIFE